MKEWKIEWLNAANNFKRETRYFETEEEATKWGKKNLENFNEDMIQFIHYLPATSLDI